MKVSQSDYIQMNTAIINAVNNSGKTISEIREVYSGYTQQRLVWDLLWASKFPTTNPQIMKQYNDAHIETALIKIVKSL